MKKFAFKHKNYSATIAITAISEKAARSYLRSTVLEPDKWVYWGENA